MIVAGTNELRKQQGRGQLHVNPQLTKAAKMFAGYVIRADAGGQIMVAQQ